MGVLYDITMLQREIEAVQRRPECRPAQIAENGDIQASKSRRSRGIVLCLMADCYPVGTTTDIVERCLLHTGKADAHEAQEHLRYLNEQGYIGVQGAPGRGIVKLLAKGIDLLGGSIPDDPEVVFP